MEETTQHVEAVLETYVRPSLREHGGNVQLACIKDGTAYVRLTGHCSGCPSAKYTLESIVKEQVTTHCGAVRDVKLQEEVSPALYEFARAILTKKNGNETKREAF